MTEKVKVEVVYALAHEATNIELLVEINTSIKSVIDQSGILIKHSDIDLSKNKIGIFSQIKSLNDSVEEGDRIEIYRPLIADPKEARRKRIQKRTN